MPGSIILATANGQALSPSNGMPLALPRFVTGPMIIRPNDTTAYAAGDLYANSTTAAQVVIPTIPIAAGIGVPGVALRCRLRKSGTVLTLALFRVHLYEVLPTVVNGDNGAWSTPGAGYAGAFDVTITRSFSDSSYGIGSSADGGVINFNPIANTNLLAYLIEVRAAYTPVAFETLTPTFELAQ